MKQPALLWLKVLFWLWSTSRSKLEGGSNAAWKDVRWKRVVVIVRLQWQMRRQTRSHINSFKIVVFDLIFWLISWKQFTGKISGCLSIYFAFIFISKLLQLMNAFILVIKSNVSWSSIDSFLMVQLTAEVHEKILRCRIFTLLGVCRNWQLGCGDGIMMDILKKDFFLTVAWTCLLITCFSCCPTATSWAFPITGSPSMLPSPGSAINLDITPFWGLILIVWRDYLFGEFLLTVSE